MSRFDHPPPLLPTGLFARSLGLPIVSFAAFSCIAWPSALGLFLLDLWEPGRTWRAFGGGATVFWISDALFMLVLAPLIIGWMAVAPRLFDGAKHDHGWMKPIAVLKRVGPIAVYVALAVLLLAGMSGAGALAGVLGEALGAVFWDGAPPLGTTAWTAEGLRVVVLGVVIWGGLILSARINRDPRSSSLKKDLGWLPRCLVVAFAFGALHELAGGTLVPIVAESLSRVDIGLAQGAYRLLGGVVDLYLPAWVAGYIAVIQTARSRAEASD